MEIIKVSVHSLLTMKLSWETMSFNILRHCVYTSVEKNLNFHITKNIFVAVNAKELNNILRINGYTKINKNNNIDEL